MLSGFNTNYRYRGVLFHVQTEDSGMENPHVITHLFHGGNIMSSQKRDYSDLLGELSGDALEDAVRKLMEGQHKAMLKGLSRGDHDATIEQRIGPDVFRAAPEAVPAEPPPVTEEQPPPPPAHTPVFKTDTDWKGRTGRTAPPPPPAPPAEAMAERTVIEAEPRESTSRLSKVFGDRVVSEKPLDEVVLDYLVENARKRKRSAK